MQRFAITLFVLSLASTAQAGLFTRLFGARVPAPVVRPAVTAQQACANQYAVITRGVPSERERAGRIGAAASVLRAMQASITNRQEAETAGKGLVRAEGGTPPIMQPLPDGMHWFFRSGNADGAGPSPEDYGLIQRRLKRAMTVLSSGSSGDESTYPVVVSVQTDPKRIMEQLRGVAPVPPKEQVDRRNFNAKMVWGAAALVLGLGGTGVRDYAVNLSNEAQLRGIIENAKKTTVFTLEDHLKMIREALEARVDPPSKQQIDRIIGEHMRWIHFQERLGVPVKFGARFNDYDQLRTPYAYGKDEMSQLEKLARRDPANVTYENLLKAAQLSAKKNDYDGVAFTTDEVEAAKKLTKDIEVVDVLKYPAVGVTAGLLAAGAAHVATTEDTRNWLALRKGAAFREQDLKAIEEAIVAALKRRTPPKSPKDKEKDKDESEWIWIGNNIIDEHTDFILRIDGSTNPPRITLVGLKYDTKLDYLKPEPKMTDKGPVVEELPTDPPHIALKKAFDQMVIDKFATNFDAALVPIKQRVETAKGMKLTPQELKQFLDVLKKVEKVTDTEILDREILKIKAKRAQG